MQMVYYFKTESASEFTEPQSPIIKEETKAPVNILDKNGMGKIEEADSEGEDEASDKEESKANNDGEYGQHHEDETLKYTTNTSTKSETVVTAPSIKKHTSIKLLSNPAITDRKCTLDAATLASDDVVQRNWISTNHEIFEVSRRLLPTYYKDISKNREETGLERAPEPVRIDDEQSYLMNVCNLFKVQFYFLLRFNHFNTYSKFQNSEKSSELNPQDERTQCNLSLSIKKFFQMINEKDFSFNQQILA